MCKPTYFASLLLTLTLVLLGASAVQIGTGFLRTPEAAIHPAWAEAIGRCAPEETMLTRAFSGRAGRSIATRYARADKGAAAAGEDKAGRL